MMLEATHHCSPHYSWSLTGPQLQLHNFTRQEAKMCARARARDATQYRTLHVAMIPLCYGHGRCQSSTRHQAKPDSAAVDGSRRTSCTTLTCQKFLSVSLCDFSPPFSCTRREIGGIFQCDLKWEFGMSSRRTVSSRGRSGGTPLHLPGHRIGVARGYYSDVLLSGAKKHLGVSLRPCVLVWIVGLLAVAKIMVTFYFYQDLHRGPQLLSSLVDQSTSERHNPIGKVTTNCRPYVLLARCRNHECAHNVTTRKHSEDFFFFLLPLAALPLQSADREGLAAAACGLHHVGLENYIYGVLPKWCKKMLKAAAGAQLQNLRYFQGALKSLSSEPFSMILGVAFTKWTACRLGGMSGLRWLFPPYSLIMLPQEDHYIQWVTTHGGKPEWCHARCSSLKLHS